MKGLILERKQIGVFSGSFNPIHVAHVVLANYITEYTYIDEVWLVLTPHNPLKLESGLISEKHRLAMCNIAASKMNNVKISQIEFSMSRPSFTINTLDRLREENQTFDFSLIIGGDNWNEIHLWKDYQRILDEYKIIVYPRPNQPLNIRHEYMEQVHVCNAPMMELSSTFIRKGIAEGRNLQAFLPFGVYDYIIRNNLYRK